MQASLQLFTATSGKLSARVAFENKTVRHLHSTVRPEAEADLYDNMQWFGNLIVFAGIGLGWHVSRALANLPAHASCIVIDYFEECTKRAAEILFAHSPNRVFFVSAENPDESRSALSSFVESVPAGSLQIIKHPASFDCFKDFYQSRIDAIARQFLRFRPDHSAGVKKALIFFGNFFLEEEVKRALAAHAIEPVLFEYRMPDNGTDFETKLSRLIQEKKPDFILSINMKGFDGNGETGRIASRFSLPLVVWFVDDPRPILLAGRIHGCPGMIALCWEKEYCAFLRTAGFAKVEYLPLACDPTMFAGASQPRTPVRMTTPLGFVGTSMVDRYAGRIRDKFLWSDALFPLVEAMSDKLCSDPAFQVYGNIPNHAQQLGIGLAFSDERNLTWLAAYIIHHASMKKRKAIVGALLPGRIETFGDPQGWKELFGEAIITHSNIDYRHELAPVYESIAINLNITSCQMPTAVNQRVFDVPMAGSFVISDNQEDLHELFEQAEIATYETIDDLQEKIWFYQGNEPERRKITGLAQKRILGEHTYTRRIKKIISLL
jgi:spore maturation protein CgeB